MPGARQGVGSGHLRRDHVRDPRADGNGLCFDHTTVKVLHRGKLSPGNMASLCVISDTSARERAITSKETSLNEKQSLSVLMRSLLFRASPRLVFLSSAEKRYVATSLHSVPPASRRRPSRGRAATAGRAV